MMSILLLILAINAITGGMPSTESSNANLTAQQGAMPKDTLIKCMQQVVDLMGSNGVSTKELMTIFLSRQSLYKIAVDTIPVVSANTISSNDMLQVYIDSQSLKDSAKYLVEIVNFPAGLIRENQGITLKDIERKFGKGTLIEWQNKIGIPPPKEYITPVRFLLPKKDDFSRAVYLDVISDHPNDDNHKGILYIRIYG